MRSHTRSLGVATILASAILAGTLPAQESKPAKVEIKLDTPENALRTYFSAWKSFDYSAIMAATYIDDPKQRDVVEKYVVYMMWTAALERACIAKFGQDEGLKVFSHVRSLDAQVDLDLKRVNRVNVENDRADPRIAKAFLPVEKDRPDGLVTDELSFRDEYDLVSVGKSWKIDFRATYKLIDNDDTVKFNAYQAYPALILKLKELTAAVKGDKIKLADDVKEEIKKAWDKVTPPDDPPTDTPAAPDAPAKPDDPAKP